MHIVTTTSEIPNTDWVEECRQDGYTEGEIVELWNEGEKEDAEWEAEMEAVRRAEIDAENAHHPDQSDWINGEPALTIVVGLKERHTDYTGTYDEASGRFVNATEGDVTHYFNWCKEHCSGAWLMTSDHQHDFTDKFRFSFLSSVDVIRFRAEFSL